MGGAGCDPKEGDVIFATAFRAASATTTLTLLTELRQGRRIYAATDTVGLRKSWPSRHIANRSALSVGRRPPPRHVCRAGPRGVASIRVRHVPPVRACATAPTSLALTSPAFRSIPPW